MRNAKLIALASVVAVVVVLVAAVAAFSSSDGDKRVVKTAQVKGKKTLVNAGGLTLYRLSAERQGRFICTSKFCLSLWKPLVVPAGTKPTGVRSLGAVRRPDGRRQVTYKGGPLYTFVQDRKPGDASGDGFKDVGVWHPAVIAGGSGNMPAQQPGYGYGGGY
jgi:predicted lipoprotein with Yx(FWY)xxD motif